MFKRIKKYFSKVERANRSAEEAILHSLKTDLNSWVFKPKFSFSSRDGISSYIYINKSKDLRFEVLYSFRNDVIKILNPIKLELDGKKTKSIIDFLEYVQNNSNFDGADFLSDHLNNSDYQLIKMSKKKFNLFDLQFWCYHQLSRKYFIDQNDPPEASKYVREDRKRHRQHIEKYKKDPYYQVYRCWFKDEGDAIHFKMIWIDKNAE